MSEAEKIDLNEVARGLAPSDLVEVADFIGYLKTKRDRDLSSASEVWEGSGASEMSGILDELERDLPSGHVEGWLADLAKNAIPIRFNPDSGEVEEIRA